MTFSGFVYLVNLDNPVEFIRKPQPKDKTFRQDLQDSQDGLRARLDWVLSHAGPGFGNPSQRGK